MDITKTKVLQGFIRMCDDGFNQGWHERNGGNLTYRMTSSEISDCEKTFSYDQNWILLKVSSEILANEFFITTGSGKFFRNVALDAEDSIGIVEINEKGDSYRIVWGLKDAGVPTSEFSSHFMNHAVRVEATSGECRVIYHAHVPAIIALSYIMPLDAKTFSRALWQSATECPVVFPGGVGVVPWMVPGGADIAFATCKVMKNFEAAIWAHHGLFCSGPNFDVTFGLMHTIEKSADIYLKVISSGKEILQTITDENLLAIAKDFGVKLRTDFLNV